MLRDFTLASCLGARSLARREASPLGSFAALKDTASHNAGSDRFPSSGNPSGVARQTLGADWCLATIYIEMLASRLTGHLNLSAEYSDHTMFTAFVM